MSEYLYSWDNFSGYRQTIEDGKVIEVISLSREEAQKEYYASRTPQLQEFDTEQEKIAKRTNQFLEQTKD